MYERLREVFKNSPDLWLSRKEIARRLSSAKSPRLVALLQQLVAEGFLRVVVFQWRGHDTYFYVFDNGEDQTSFDTPLGNGEHNEQKTA